MESILAQARRGGPLRVVNDQFGAPTYTVDLAEKIGQLVVSAPLGIYHITNQGFCSWFDFAQQILRLAGFSGLPVVPISASECGRAARRPVNSRLAPAKLQALGLPLLPYWEDALARYLALERRRGQAGHE